MNTAPLGVRTYTTAKVIRADGTVEDLGIVSDSQWNWFRRSVIERARRWYLRRFLKRG